MLSTVQFSQVQNDIQSALLSLRRALEYVENAYLAAAAEGAAGLALLPGGNTDDAEILMDGIADAYALVQLQNTGTLAAPPSGYLTPGTYIFGNSQRIAIGPQSG